MIARLFDKLIRPRAKASFATEISVPGRVYAIGDVHGSAGLLERLLSRISAECREDEVEATCVLLGDYVDRGDSSRAVLDIVMALDRVPGIRGVALRGNHEQMLLDFVEGRAGSRQWLTFGGLQTLLSYGVGGVVAMGDDGDERLRAALAEALGPHLDLLRALGHSHQEGNVFFAHAGADPSRPLALQQDAALLWGAPGFFESPREDGNWVVYGHHIVDEPGLSEGRIGIDTGAYVTQCLTAVRLEGSEVRFLQERDD